MAIRGPLVAECRDAFSRHWRATRTTLAPPQALPAPPAKAGDDRVCLLDSHGNRLSRSPIRLAYEDAIRHAQERAWLTQAYFIPDRKLIACLGEATARGTDVRVLVAGPTDSVMVKYASDAWYDALLAVGVRIYELETAVLHAKTAVIDGCWATIGSCNLDDRSAWQNDEMNAVVLSRAFGAEMEGLFERDLSCAREINRDQWRERHFGRRVMEQACRLVSPWL
jgi:cardiolipin synthase